MRMRLVEQRRQIELGKRRAEMKWTEQLDKQAFIQVNSRGKGNAPGGDGRQEEADLSVESKQPVVQGTRKESRALRGEPDEVMKWMSMWTRNTTKHRITTSPRTTPDCDIATWWMTLKKNVRNCHRNNNGLMRSRHQGYHPTDRSLITCRSLMRRLATTPTVDAEHSSDPLKPGEPAGVRHITQLAEQQSDRASG